MKISFEKYPILGYLHNPDAGIGLKIPAGEEKKAWEMFDDFFQDPHDTAPIFREHVDAVSMPFIRAAWMNREKILTHETLREILREPIYGCLIVGRWVTLYYFKMSPNGDVGHKALTCCGEHLVAINTGSGSYLVPRDYMGKLGQDIQAESYDYYPLFFHLFKKYADVETVEAKMNKKVKAPDGEKILVESDITVSYTDCSWFRTIIRKEGFIVRGHFKMQPYKKDGEWTHRLIYIEPYQKHGYTRKAKKTQS